MEYVVLDCICPYCGIFSQITIGLEEYTNWLNGTCIQDAFPELDASERESIKTGICDECYGE